MILGDSYITFNRKVSNFRGHFVSLESKFRGHLKQKPAKSRFFEGRKTMYTAIFHGCKTDNFFFTAVKPIIFR